MTEWRETVRGYQVSDDGQVRSPSGRIRKLFLRDDGRLAVTLTYGKPVTFKVHRLVCLAWHGPPEPGQETRHLNGNPADNRQENLAWGTSKENAADDLVNGTRLRGEKVPNVKLTEEQVLEAVYRVNSGERVVSVAADMNVNQATISSIMSGIHWGHLTGITGRSKWERYAHTSVHVRASFGTGKQVKSPCPNGCGLETYPGPMGRHLQKCRVDKVDKSV